MMDDPNRRDTPPGGAASEQGSDGRPRSLRARAIARLDVTLDAEADAPRPGARAATAAELQRVVHELRVHQIELEIQNEELRASRQATERERMRYLELYDFAPSGYLSLSADGTIRELNLTAVTMLAQPRARLVGRLLQAMVHESSVTTLLACVSRVFAEETTQECDVVLPVEGTPARTFRLCGTFDAQQGLCRLSMLDVTTQRVLERAQRQSQRMEAVGRLAGGIAHDFNNLLTVINGCSAVIEAELDASHPMRTIAHEISVAGDRAATLTRQLLTFSRRLPHDVRRLEVNELLRELAGLLQRLLGADVALRLDTCPTPLHVMLDLGQFEQAMINLVVNARDAMPHGGTVHIRTSLTAGPATDATGMQGAQVFRHAPLGSVPAGDYVQISVEDTGAGMDPATVANVFEPFFTTKETGKGTGLGLAVVFGIVQQAGGFITLGSEVDRGTRLSLFFRCAPVPDAAGPSGRDTPPVGVETVLLVEDERSVRHLTCRMLEARGYHVLEAPNGSTAMKLAHEHPDPIDALVVDVIMPEMSGWDVATGVLTVRPDVAVLFTSGLGVSPEDVRDFSTSAAAFLPKPYSSHDLLAAVRAVLDARAASAKGAG